MACPLWADDCGHHFAFSATHCVTNAVILQCKRVKKSGQRDYMMDNGQAIKLDSTAET
jgi:hypothetical protein